MFPRIHIPKNLGRRFLRGDVLHLCLHCCFIFIFLYDLVILMSQPVIFLHGGPGGGTSPNNRRFFDPEFYRIILLDQVTSSTFISV